MERTVPAWVRTQFVATGLLKIEFGLFFLRFYYLFIYLSSEGRGGRKRGRETSMYERNSYQLPCECPQPGTWLAHNPGMCPDQESNQWPFSLQDDAPPTEPWHPGLNLVFKKVKTLGLGRKGQIVVNQIDWHVEDWCVYWPVLVSIVSEPRWGPVVKRWAPCLAVEGLAVPLTIPFLSPTPRIYAPMYSSLPAVLPPGKRLSLVIAR